MKLFIAAILTFFSSGAFAMLEASPSFVNFSDVELNSTNTQYIDVMNESSDTATDISMFGACPGDFQIENMCPFSLSPYSSCEVMVEFRPTSTMYQTCEINFESPDGSTEISVQGQGIANP